MRTAGLGTEYDDKIVNWERVGGAMRKQYNEHLGAIMEDHRAVRNSTERPTEANKTDMTVRRNRPTETKLSEG